MEFQIKILLVSFSVTLILSILIIPILKRLRVGQMERDDGPQSHLKKQGTPTMGGIIILIAITIASIGGYLYYSRQEGGLEVAQHILPLIFIAFGFGLVGFIDDFKKIVLKNPKGISAKAKMIGLLVISVLFVLYLVKILNIGTETVVPFLKTNIELPIWLFIPFAIFVMLATTNAINLTDGVDGLAASTSTIIITCLTVIAVIFDVKEVVVFGTITVGACLRFLTIQLKSGKNNDGGYRIIIIRRNYLSNGIILKSAININNNSINTSIRNIISYNTSSIFQKNRK